MTFSIVGRCVQTGELGVAISSSSIAVGARCPWVSAGVGAVSTQNVTLPALGQRVLDQLQDKSMSAQSALELALETDEWNAYRQLVVVDAQGRSALFTGPEALGINHALAGHQCAAAGNLLAGSQVIQAMVQRFEKSSGMLADRLLAALHAGLAAGGEAGPVHSAALNVAGDKSWPIVDLRVDWADDQPIEKLDALWQSYRPQMQAYLTRALYPAAAPSYGVPGDA